MKQPIKLDFKGKTIRVVGSRLVTTEPTNTGHEFLLKLFKTELGEKWWREEFSKPDDQRHIIMDWFESYGTFIKEKSTDDDKVDGGWSSIMSGDVQSLLCLAYDLYCLQHVKNLPIHLFNRLKIKEQFQGARYEIAVTALFVKMEYEVQFIKKTGESHCEFIATRPNTNEKVAVEAKSRHRSGILKFLRKNISLKKTKIGILRLLNEAFKQGLDDLPFIVFIDINLPVSKDIKHPDREWWKDLKHAIEAIGTPTSDNPDPYSAIVITNYSYHYAGANQIDVNDYSQDSVMVISPIPKYPFSLSNTPDLIYQGVNAMWYVPNNV